MTKNLHAVNDFQKVDLGQVSGHRVNKVPGVTPQGDSLVRALQDVKAGMHGWFDDSPKAM